MYEMIYIGLVGLLFLLAFILSTLLIRIGVPKLKTDFIETKSTDYDPIAELMRDGRLPESSRAGRIFDWQSTGLWIGLTETILIFILVFANAFSALAIIIGAKQFVRNEKIKLVPSYYLLGTLANLCIATLFALAAKHISPEIVAALAEYRLADVAAVDLIAKTQEGAECLL